MRSSTTEFLGGGGEFVQGNYVLIPLPLQNGEN